MFFFIIFFFLWKQYINKKIMKPNIYLFNPFFLRNCVCVCRIHESLKKIKIIKFNAFFRYKYMWYERNLAFFHHYYLNYICDQTPFFIDFLWMFLHHDLLVEVESSLLISIFVYQYLCVVNKLSSSLACNWTSFFLWERGMSCVYF